MRPKTWYKRQPYGPITTQRTEDQTTATGPGGRTVVVEAAAWKDPAATKVALDAGVAVTLDGQHVATVRRAGTRMAGIRPQLTTGGRTLIRPPFPTFLTRPYMLSIDPTLDPAMVLIYAAIDFGLYESLGP